MAAGEYDGKPGHWAYLIGGNEGILLCFKDGSSVLIGTQKSTEAKKFLKERGLI